MAIDLRILAIPKNLAVGGSQVSAVDFARALRTRGHEVVVASDDGPLRSKLDESGIEVRALPRSETRTRRIAVMASLIRSVRPDVIHCYEVRQVLDACYATKLVGGPPILGSILSTRVPWFLPESVHLTVGMPNLLEFTRRWRSGPVTLLQPPIQVSNGVEAELPGQASLGSIRYLVVLVSRLVLPFKKEGILRTISAMTDLAPKGFGLLLVGDGEARGTYETAANTANRKIGHRGIAFSGELLGPSAVFASADIVIGNGASVMTGVAHGKPAVVVGREGFSVVVNSSTLGDLVASGFYGVGQGSKEPDPLPAQILAAFEESSPDKLAAARDYVLARYGIEEAVERLERCLVGAASGAPLSVGELSRVPFRLLHYRWRRARFRIQAESRGLEAEQADNFVYGRLRDMALPPSRFGTGRNRRSETQLPDDSTA